MLKRLDGPLGLAQQAGDLGIAQCFYELEHDYVLLVAGQLLYRCQQALRGLYLFDLLLRFVRPRKVILQGCRPGPSRAAVVIGHPCLSDAVQPGTKRPAPVYVGRQALDGAHKDLGGEVLCQLLVADAVVDVAIDRLDVRSLQLANGLLL
jgi:hypothetical protein